MSNFFYLTSRFVALVVYHASNLNLEECKVKENDLAKTESIGDLNIKPNNFMDSLIDSLSHDMYLGKSMYVGVNELPFWIQRFIAQHKKKYIGYAPIIWTMGEPTTCEIEDRIEAYFKNQFPNIEVIALEANANIARELNEAFIEHGEYVDSKQKTGSR